LLYVRIRGKFAACIVYQLLPFLFFLLKNVGELRFITIQHNHTHQMHTHTNTWLRTGSHTTTQPNQLTIKLHLNLPKVKMYHNNAFNKESAL
jgi:hypothetical protein